MSDNVESHMNGNRSTFNFRLNQRGQIALFIALVFQVLFLFFAMVINVGLLVHHKVNLQNSVDLAAYYGAAKQAENLNAIGHMNYQIRQSWKLLTWRYRMLGSAGEDDTGRGGGNAYNRVSTQISPDLDTVETTNVNVKNFQTAPPFCIIYKPFSDVEGSNNMCKRASGMQAITLFDVPPVISISPGDRTLAATVRAFTLQMLTLAVNECKSLGSLNYTMLSRFVGAFVVDQADRLAVINAMAGQMSSSDSDFMDLDGESVASGVQKTFQKNLTSANSATAKMEFFNSLGSGSCAQNSSGKGGPPNWLATVNIMPGMNYMDAECGRATAPFPQVFDSDDNHKPKWRAQAQPASLGPLVDSLAKLIGYKPGP